MKQKHFLTAILHRGLRNDFFFISIPIYFFQFLFGLLFPFSIWTFISLFYFIFQFHFFEFQFDYFEFQFDYFELQFDYFEFQFEFQFFLISFSYQSRSHFGFLPNFLLRSVSRPFPPCLLPSLKIPTSIMDGP